MSVQDELYELSGTLLALADTLDMAAQHVSRTAVHVTSIIHDLDARDVDPLAEVELEQAARPLIEP